MQLKKGKVLTLYCPGPTETQECWAEKRKELALEYRHCVHFKYELWGVALTNLGEGAVQVEKSFGTSG